MALACQHPLCKAEACEPRQCEEVCCCISIKRPAVLPEVTSVRVSPSPSVETLCFKQNSFWTLSSVASLQLLAAQAHPRWSPCYGFVCGPAVSFCGIRRELVAIRLLLVISTTSCHDGKKDSFLFPFLSLLLDVQDMVEVMDSTRDTVFILWCPVQAYC